MSDELDPEDASVHEDEAAALDYAVGGLDRAGMHRAQLRLNRDPAFRAEVEQWQALLSPLVETIAPVAPPPGLWDRIAAETGSVTAPSRVAAAPAVERPTFWSSLGLWRGWAVASTALAGVAVVMLLSRPEPAAAPQLLVATLASPTGSALLTATYDAARGAVILTPADKAATDGRTPELWVIEGDNPPRSLGVIDIGTPEDHAIPTERLKGLKEGSTLAISLEPPGGSKTGAPTGPIVATGKLTGI